MYSYEYFCDHFPQFDSYLQLLHILNFNVVYLIKYLM